MIPQELRIGNWVDYRMSDNPIQIAAKDLLDAETRPLDGWQMIYKPIHLNSEILEAVGFEMDAAYQIPKWKNKEGFFFFSESGIDDFSVRLMDRFDIEIQYLHQLQNLYYLLTGKELTYTPVTEKA